MTKPTFRRATKADARLRMALVGPSGSGKTWSALAIATGLGDRVAVLDTERGSAAKYAGDFSFDVAPIESYGPQDFVDGIEAAEAAGYDVLIVDSLSHQWIGILEWVDDQKARSKNAMAPWAKATPMHRAVFDALLRSRCHVIATMRQKTEWLVDGGKVEKVGLAPVARDGSEYEFDIVAELDTLHTLRVVKTRWSALDGATIRTPGAELGTKLRGWVGSSPAAKPVAVATEPSAVAAGPKGKIEWQDPSTMSVAKTHEELDFWRELMGPDRFAEIVPVAPSTLGQARRVVEDLRRCHEEARPPTEDEETPWGAVGQSVPDESVGAPDELIEEARAAGAKKSRTRAVKQPVKLPMLVGHIGGGHE